MGQAASLEDEVLDPEVRAFVLSLANDTIEADTDWVKAVATVVAKKAPAEWTDDDLLRFRRELHQQFAAFHRLVALHADRRASGGGPFEAYRVTVTRSDGVEQPLLVGGRPGTASRGRRRPRRCPTKAHRSHRITRASAPHPACPARRAAPARRGPKYRGQSRAKQ